MIIPTMKIPVDYKTGRLLKHLRPLPWDSMSSTIRFLVTAAIDRRTGFAGRGYLLFGEAHPMPYATAKAIYLDILCTMHALDQETLDHFYGRSEHEIRLNSKRKVRPIVKHGDDNYLNKQRACMSAEKIGDYSIATHGAPETFERWLNMMMAANGFEKNELIVFWKL